MTFWTLTRKKQKKKGKRKKKHWKKQKEKKNHKRGRGGWKLENQKMTPHLYLRCRFQNFKKKKKNTKKESNPLRRKDPSKQRQQQQQPLVSLQISQPSRVGALNFTLQRRVPLSPPPLTPYPSHLGIGFSFLTFQQCMVNVRLCHLKVAPAWKSSLVLFGAWLIIDHRLARS